MIMPNSLKTNILLLVWFVSVAFGFSTMMIHDTKPSQEAAAPLTMYKEEAQLADDRNFTMVVFLHPRCPCSVATLDCLDRLLARPENAKKMRAVVYLVCPPGTDRDWAAPLYEKCKTLPSARIAFDDCGRTANKYGARSSGQVLLYSPQGELVFSGGLTNARGQFGESGAELAIQEIISRKSTTTVGQSFFRHPVFGCALLNSPCRVDGGGK